jgi:glycogen debranching enzyme
MRGPYFGLPRAAGWGYPEPYTRDCLICALGILVSANQILIASLREVLETLSRNQSPRGHIPSLVHDPENRGASDTTPLFLMILTFFRKATGELNFLTDALRRALNWMDYQIPEDRVLVAQLPTSDWRDGFAQRTSHESIVSQHIVLNGLPLLLRMTSEMLRSCQRLEILRFLH